MSELLNTYEKSFRKNNDIIMSNFNKINLEPNKDNNNDPKSKINKSYLLEEIDKLIEEQKKNIKTNGNRSIFFIK